VRFGFIGSLAPHKGVEWLIRQFDKSFGELLIAGTGSSRYEDHLKQIARGKAITFLGHCPSLSFFPRIDVNGTPSIWEEALGGVALEAAAHGRPVMHGAAACRKSSVTGKTACLSTPTDQKRWARQCSASPKIVTCLPAWQPPRRPQLPISPTSTAFSTNTVRSMQTSWARKPTAGAPRSSGVDCARFGAMPEPSRRL